MTSSPGADARDRATLVAVTALGSELQTLARDDDVRDTVVSRTARMLDATVTMWSVLDEPTRRIHAGAVSHAGSAPIVGDARPPSEVRDVLRTGVAVLARSPAGSKSLFVPFAVLARTAGVMQVDVGDQERVLDAGDLAATMAVAERLGSELTARRLRDDYRHRAEHDVLTGLPNRAALIEQLDTAICAADDGGPHPHVIFLDVDEFKLVNDTLGHAAGDAVLLSVSQRLRRQIRDGDAVARFGGDEFVILLRQSMSSTDLDAVLERLTGPGADPVVVHGHRVYVTLSAGMSRYRVGCTSSSMLSQADAAMFDAKGSAAQHWREFDEPMQVRAAGRLRVNSDLRDALTGAELFCEYQPIVDLGSGSVLAHEALVRWQHPTRGRLEPGEFIPTAENSDLMYGVTERVLSLAVDQAVAWPESVSVSVNISGRVVGDPRLLALVLHELERSGLEQHRLILEITETAVMADPQRAMQMLHALHGMGVRIAVDDFGTGYTSIDDLVRMPLDIVKIDRSFVSASQTPRGQAMMRALTTLATALGVPALAEGVESAQELAVVAESGCALAQGFLLRRPAMPDQVRHTVALPQAEPVT